MSVSRPGSSVGFERRAALHADRVLDAAQEFHVRLIGLARAVADPQHVAGGCIPVVRAAGLVAAHERLLVAE